MRLKKILYVVLGCIGVGLVLIMHGFSFRIFLLFFRQI